MDTVDDEEEDKGLLRSTLSGGPGQRENPEVNGHTISLEEMFEAAVKVIQCVPKDGPYQPSNSTKLRFYSLYKQATEGKSTQPQPSIFNMVNRAKWDAWNRLGDMGREAAMKQYIDELKAIVETMSMSGEVQNFLEAINPFYEFVNQDDDELENGKKSSELGAWTVSCSSTSETETSSSSSTSNQNTPGHIKTGIQNGWNSRNGDRVHINENGHGSEEEDETDKEDLEGPPSPCNKVNEHFTNHRLVSSFHPPAAPVHRPSITATTLPPLQSRVITSSPSKSDQVEDVLKVDVDLTRRGQGEEWGNSTLHARLSAEDLHSGTESEKYYSGDSEPEAEVGVRRNCAQVPVHLCPGITSEPHPANSLFSLPAALSCSSSSSGMNEAERDCQQPHLNLVLQHTVERLNRDVDHILARIRLLEAAYATNEQFSNATMAVTERRKKMTLFGLTPQALTLIITWPVLVLFVSKLVKLWLRRRRRING